MKKEYAAPELQVEKIDVVDVIAASVGGDNDNTGTGGTEIVNPF